MKATRFNRKTIAEFHAKQGRGVGRFGDHLLLMTSRGAKSGEAITTPLVYGRDGNAYVIVASNDAAPTHPHWFGNIAAHSEVRVEVANADAMENFRACARVVESRPERDRLFMEMSKIFPPYLDFQKRVNRVIPVIMLERYGDAAAGASAEAGPDVNSNKRRNTYPGDLPAAVHERVPLVAAPGMVPDAGEIPPEFAK